MSSESFLYRNPDVPGTPEIDRLAIDDLMGRRIVYADVGVTAEPWPGYWDKIVDMITDPDTQGQFFDTPRPVMLDQDLRPLGE